MLSIKLFSAFLILASSCHAFLEEGVLKCTSCSSSNINPKANSNIKCGQVGNCIGCGTPNYAECDNKFSYSEWKCNDCGAEGVTEHYVELHSLGCGATHDFTCTDCQRNSRNRRRIRISG
ncbi:hypothetical protein O181_108245 [Austropuccinia psidii MF-1]|uniref:Uncharacterized protein n=1 Tax=Austropuccinia psidii MF-1 TaxID=1389203 RepID=A0A9Q3JRZ8_9BASI|nr:hypothetical protein [Austropuccinia psidii MF-1]